MSLVWKRREETPIDRPWDVNVPLVLWTVVIDFSCHVNIALTDLLLTCVFVGDNTSIHW